MTSNSESIIYENVKLGINCEIEPYCILGISPSKTNLTLVIGDAAKIRAGTYIYEGNNIGNNFQTGNKANIRENNTIGDNVSVGTLSVIEYQVKIEDDVRIHTQVFIPEFSIIKKGSFIGPNVVLTNAKYPLSKDVKSNLQGPIIEESVKIGANSTLLPGVRIGANSIIGAGSVITKDVPANSVVVGNPGKVIRLIDKIPNDPYDQT